MKFELVSDLHLDILTKENKNPEHYLEKVFSKPKAPILFIAGDIQDDLPTPTELTKYFFDLVCDRYERVFSVLGNHDYMGENETIDSTIPAVREIFPNVTWLDNDFVKIDDVWLYGSTFWSEIRPENSDVAELSMPDYQSIRDLDNRKITTQTTNKINRQSRDILVNWLSQNPDEQLVVLTHHAPSFRSTPYPESPLSEAFCNDLEPMVERNPNISLWLYGHVHEPVDYMLGWTRVVCNPFGYWGTEVTPSIPYKPILLNL